ncbi:ParA family protein [Piscinibacter sp.]|uniref:ParA family protein n=1 Tax=Piscinibacter sp. TaxID=1903157 RepID=UPI002BF18D8D|nr:ParA family protein [Albitalea sp.]HUG23952.1 ParA family protein [Albitalea sp.]
MPVIAVINRKGGSGKSTLATHLAAHCATQGLPVMLGDVDRQQSTRVWLRQREKQQPRQGAPIVGWTVDPKSVLRPPAGIRHVVLDTPGGLRGFDLVRVVAFADAVLMPVCHSVFDRESAAECFAELMTLPRVASGRCKVAAIGMRVDARTKGAEVLEAWAAERELPFVGVLRETQAYVRCVEQGLTLFDLPAAQVQADMAQWKPILDWLAPVLCPAPPAAGAAVPSSRAHAATAPARPATAPGPVAKAGPAKPASLESLERRGTRWRTGGLLEWLTLPRFLQRKRGRRAFSRSEL